MRIATFNVENLFDRARVFNDEDPDKHREVIDAHAKLSKLFELEQYTDDVKTEMLELIAQLGMSKRDEGRFTRIRKIRGQLISRPRNRAPFIKARGRENWIGWCELRTEAVDELAMSHTANMIADLNADVLAIVEAESRPVLLKFHKLMLDRLGLEAEDGYRHIMVIDGNDRRGIDVGLASKTNFPIGTMRSHVNDLKPDGQPVFSRDCPEYEITTPGGETVFFLPNHFKSKFGGNDQSSRNKRLAQATAVKKYYDRLIAEGNPNVVVLGDLNDTRESDELAPLLQGTNLRDADTHPAFTNFEFTANNGERGIGTYGLGNDDSKIDYLLLSPALFERVNSGGIFRKGCWPGSRPKRWNVYETLKKKEQSASDHHAIWVDLDGFDY